LIVKLGVYYQAFMLAPPRWRRIAGWVCGWMYLVGNISITLSVNFGTTLFFVACVNVFEKTPATADAPAVGVLEGSAYQIYLIFLGITLLCNAVSSLGNKYLPWLDVSSPAKCPL
jgi:amino acid transporter